MLYVGAEYCPYCAAQRWGLVVALSRFGTWSGLGQTHSSSSDVFPNTATLSFHGAVYTSRYVSFTGYETTTNELAGNQYKPLDTPSAADEQIFNTYDRQSYVKGSGGIPFIDLGGAWAMSGASSRRRAGHSRTRPTPRRNRVIAIPTIEPPRGRQPGADRPRRTGRTGRNVIRRRCRLEVGVAVCELRRVHPRWGQRRLRHELGRNGCPGPVPWEASIYRLLVRRGLIEPNQRRRREDYRRWDRPGDITR